MKKVSAIKEVDSNTAHLAEQQNTVLLNEQQLPVNPPASGIQPVINSENPSPGETGVIEGSVSPDSEQLANLVIDDKTKEKLKNAADYVKNNDLKNAEVLYKEIAAENKGTALEIIANKAIENLNKASGALDQASENIALSYLKQMHTCINSHIVENGNFPPMNNLENTKEFFESQCSLNKDFFPKYVKDITFIDSSLNFRILVELNSGEKYEINQTGINAS